MVEMDYQELRKWASENNIDVSQSPTKEELEQAYEEHSEKNPELSEYDERVIE